LIRNWTVSGTAQFQRSVMVMLLLETNDFSFACF
jgi:hypothetical protein